MDDHSLMRALYAEGIQPAVIAEKFETSVRAVNLVLGLSETDARIIRTYQRFWRMAGEEEVTSADLSKKMGMNSGYVMNYLRTLESRGHIMRIGLQVRKGHSGKPMVIWKMVRIQEWIPQEQQEEAA